MSDPEPSFEELRGQVAEAVSEGDLDSVYAGLVCADGRREYYFGNDVDEEELRELAAVQLGMLLRVLADRSARDVGEVAELAVERAEELELR